MVARGKMALFGVGITPIPSTDSGQALTLPHRGGREKKGNCVAASFAEWGLVEGFGVSAGRFRRESFNRLRMSGLGEDVGGDNWVCARISSQR